MIVGNQPGVGLNTIFQLDCIFVKDFDEINSFNDEKLKKLILIMFHCYKSYDFVDYLICKLDKISNTTYIKEYRKLIPSLKISKKY